MERSEDMSKINSYLHADQIVIKSAYLAVRETSKKWTLPIRNWGMILNQFLAIFEERVKL